jgi:putative peptidoglycan lipid II flippase
MMLTPFIFSISGLLMGILQAHQRFLLPSLAISMNNVGLIIGAVILARLPIFHTNGAAEVGGANVFGLAWGAVLSAILHLGIQLPGLRTIPAARIRFLANWRIPGVAEVLKLMGPRVLGLGITQINFAVNVAFSSAMVAGSLSALNTAWFLMFFALGIIGQSVGSAVFPSLTALAADNDMTGFKERFAGALRGVLFLAIPATFGLMLLGRPVIAILFQRGEWTTQSTDATAWALTFFALGMAGHAALEVLSRAFYALADTQTPVVVGMISMISNIILSIVFIRVIGDPTSLERGPFAGLALANSITTLLEGLALWWLLRRRIGDLRDGYVGDGVVKTLGAALIMSAALVGLNTLATGRLSLPVVAIIGGPLGIGVFVGASILLGLDEPRSIVGMIVRRIRR